jgi:hypothetical protein
MFVGNCAEAPRGSHFAVVQLGIDGLAVELKRVAVGLEIEYYVTGVARETVPSSLLAVAAGLPVAALCIGVVEHE